MLCVRELCHQKGNVQCLRVAHIIENEWRARLGIGTWEPQTNTLPDRRAEQYLRAEWVPSYYFIRPGQDGEDAVDCMNRPSKPIFHFHVLGYTDVVVIQGKLALLALIFRRKGDLWKQVVFSDTPLVVRPELRASVARLRVYPLLDYFDLFDDAVEILYINIRDDSQVVWLHMSEVFELRTDGSKWLPYVDSASECVDCDRA